MEQQHLAVQTTWLFLLAIPVACISWTVTHEEIFKAPREYCIRKSRDEKKVLTSRFFYVFTCEYCFSHYIALLIAALSAFRLLLPGWRGYVLGWFSLVWIANVYMSLFILLRMGIKRERTEIKYTEEKINEEEKSPSQ